MIMTIKRILVYLLILMIIAFPVSAGDVSLSRWASNVTLTDDGLVDELIQVEIENGGSSPLEGFSFMVPSPSVILDFNRTTGVMIDNEGNMKFTEIEMNKQEISGKTKIIINFNNPIETGKKWSGRISFIAEKWAGKEDGSFSINIPIEAPEAIVSKKNIKTTVPLDADIRSQVFFPKYIEITSVTPKPFRILFQYDLMVPTWTPEMLHIGDTISIKGQFSEVLKKIVDADQIARTLALRIKEEKAKGGDVSEAEAHLKNAEDYNTNNANSAISSFWTKDNKAAFEFVGYANDELDKAKDSLTVKAEPKAVPQQTENKKTPGIGTFSGILILFVSFHVFKDKRKYGR